MATLEAGSESYLELPNDHASDGLSDELRYLACRDASSVLQKQLRSFFFQKVKQSMEVVYLYFRSPQDR